MKTKIKPYYANPDENTIMNIVEKLWDEKDELIGKTIDWETWTIKYLCENMPVDDLSEIYWKRFRLEMKNKVNKKLRDSKKPCKLKVQYGIGLQLQKNGAAVLNTIVERGNKICSVLQTSHDIAIDEAEAYQSYPEAKKIFKMWGNSVSTLQYAYYGQIDTSKLPAEIKSAIKNRIRKSLPANID